VEFGVLGALRVWNGGGEVEIRKGIPRRLLVALILRAPDTVSSDLLMELLWGDEQPRNPANALQTQVSYLRRALAAADGNQPIATRPGGYALEIDDTAVDAARFERALIESVGVGEGLDEDLEGRLRAVEDALALWRGDALADVRDEAFAEGTVARLEELRWVAREVRNDLLLELGRHAEVVGEARTQLADQPLRERLWEQLVLALYRSGRQADALRAYEEARITLIEELGLDPGSALQQLQHDVLAHAPGLAWVPPAVGEAAVTREPAGWRRNFVPAPVTPIIGRDREIARLVDLLDRSRLVVLTGPGGAGKTRLAVDLATRAGSESSVWFVDLSAVDLDELVAPTVAAALGATVGPAEDPVEVVAGAFANEYGLLVLDTCEHVVAGAGRLTSALLRRAPGVKVLGTSRRPLAVAGETVWPVPPLGLPSADDDAEAIESSAAVRLFCERARAVQPSFALDAETAADVMAICHALDGLPLAIELAAARADVLSPVAILARLNDRFDLLVEGAADAAARQRTLRGAIDWSVELLTDEQRTFFARLGVFAGGFDLAAAEAIAAAPGHDGLGLLSALVRHSMVVNDGRDRFRLLDSLRAYAADLLADLDADATRRRHARHYTELAERSEHLIRGASQTEALLRLRAEIPNFRAALEWSLGVGDLDVAARLAGSLAWFWALDGRLDVADRHLRRAIAIEDVSPVVRSKVLWGYALLVSGLGNIDEAAEAASTSVALARRAGDDAAIGAGLNALAVAQWAAGELDAAAETHDEAIERFVSAGDDWGEAICRVLRARTALDRRDDDVRERLAEALAVAGRCGDAHVIGLALGLIAQVEAAAGELEQATALARESLALQESIGYTEGTIAALHQLAELLTEAGDHEAAHDALVRSLRLAWKIQHAAAICEALEALGDLALVADDESRARTLLEAAGRERDRRHLPPRVADRERLADQRDRLARAATPPERDLAETVAEVLR
jgi:predicted ATPase/DNA-binding SARP family transcriptional activator